MDVREQLEALADTENVDVRRYRMDDFDGLYCNGVVFINPDVTDTPYHYNCILAEELGHHFKSTGNIVHEDTAMKRKEERKGRVWAYHHLASPDAIAFAISEGARDVSSLCEALSVTPEFLAEAVRYYRAAYGVYVVCQDMILMLEPLAVRARYAK